MQDDAIEVSRDESVILYFLLVRQELLNKFNFGGLNNQYIKLLQPVNWFALSNVDHINFHLDRNMPDQQISFSWSIDRNFLRIRLPKNN